MKKLLLTGGNSGIGYAINTLLSVDFEIFSLTRDILDLNDITQVEKFDMSGYSVLINCAGHDVGGKTEFIKQDTKSMLDIYNVNSFSPMILTKNFINNNEEGIIINITSTSVDYIWPNMLNYSISKIMIESFTTGLRRELKNRPFRLIEIKPGLTETNFNNNRYTNRENLNSSIYQDNPTLSPEQVADSVKYAIENNDVDLITIRPKGQM